MQTNCSRVTSLAAESQPSERNDFSHKLFQADVSHALRPFDAEVARINAYHVKPKRCTVHRLGADVGLHNFAPQMSPVISILLLSPLLLVTLDESFIFICLLYFHEVSFSSWICQEEWYHETALRQLTFSRARRAQSTRCYHLVVPQKGLGLRVNVERELRCSAGGMRKSNFFTSTTM